MQPQPPADQSTPDYNFILQGNQKPKKPLGLPKLNLPKPLKLLLIAGLVFLLLILFLALKGGSGNSTPGINVAARQHEILRVSKLAGGNLTDPQAQNLQANVAAIFTTEQKNIVSFLKIKSGDGRLNKFKSTATDSQLQTAEANNNYDSVYLAWLKQSLTSYEQDLQNTLPQGTARQSALSEPYKTYSQDAAALLAAPPLMNL